MERTIGSIKLRLKQGDITKEKADALVNAANNHLWMGAGVAGAIKKKGGEIIEREAVAQGPIPIGEAVITSAGELKAKYVIHAAGMGQDMKTDVQKVRAATRNSLLRAEEKRLESVVFPAIGTGVGGLSIHACARAMLEVTLEFLQESQSLRKVIVVLFDRGTFNAFQQRLAEMFSAGEHP